METGWERAGGRGDVGTVSFVSHTFSPSHIPKVVSHSLPRGRGGVIRISPGCSPLLHPSLRVHGSHPHPEELGESLGHVCHSPSPPPGQGQGWEEPSGDPIWKPKVLPRPRLGGLEDVAAHQSGHKEVLFETVCEKSPAWRVGNYDCPAGT